MLTVLPNILNCLALEDFALITLQRYYWII